MIELARRRRVLAAGLAAAAAGVLGFAGATSASAQPAYPQPPMPAPATVTQTVTVAPDAAPQSVASPGVMPATVASPGSVTAPGPGVATPALGATPSPGLVAAPVAAPPPVTIAPASSGTIFDYFQEKDVTVEPQRSEGFTALNIVLPMPRGWSHVPDPNVPDAFAVIADRVGGNGLYTSNAQVVVRKLIGDFDPKEAISHGFIDSQELPAWRTTDASLADYGGMPSSLIEGTYRENNMTMNTSRRHVIATAGPDRYLVSLAVTTSVDQAVPAADATDAIVNGFRVSVPTAQRPQAPPPSQAAAPQPAPAAAAAVTPQLLGLPG